MKPIEWKRIRLQPNIQSRSLPVH